MPPEPVAGPDAALPAEELVEAGVYPTPEAGFDHGLVVLAMGESFFLIPSERGYQLLVAAAVAPALREQLEKYDRESVGWPPPAPVEQVARRPVAVFGPLLWGWVVLTVFWAQGRWPESLQKWGELDSQKIFAEGQWWRPATALFLHADAEHLLANLLSGMLVFSAVLTTLGRWRGWALLALAAVAGNLAVAALSYPGPYQSLGASTAIFAGLGLLTGRAVRMALRAGHPHRWRAVLVPLMAGATLLGLHGVGALRTDVAAHGAGFAAGALLGFAAARWGAGAAKRAANGIR